MAPRAADREGSRHPISFRTTQEVREKLERAASFNGRSLTQELEYRLERSFESSELLEKAIRFAIAGLYGSDETADLCQRIALTIKHVERATGKKWSDDAVTKFEARSGTVALVLKVMDGPKPTKKEYGRLVQGFGAAIGEANAGLVELPQFVVHDSLTQPEDD